MDINYVLEWKEEKKKPKFALFMKNEAIWKWLMSFWQHNKLMFDSKENTNKMFELLWLIIY